MLGLYFTPPQPSGPNGGRRAPAQRSHAASRRSPYLGGIAIRTSSEICSLVSGADMNFVATASACRPKPVASPPARERPVRAGSSARGWRHRGSGRSRRRAPDRASIGAALAQNRSLRIVRSRSQSAPCTAIVAPRKVSRCATKPKRVGCHAHRSSISRYQIVESVRIHRGLFNAIRMHSSLATAYL
jgi:hypothetical protein